MVVRILAVLMFLAMPAYAEELRNGDTLTVKVTATIKEMGPPTEDMIIEQTEEPQHYCEEHPEGVGCKYYKPEDGE